MSWFKRLFGVDEGEFTSTAFKMKQWVLQGPNGEKYVVGPFGVYTLRHLRSQVKTTPVPGGLTFDNMVGDVGELIQDVRNAGAVFQVASQFNCLEMVSPRVAPEAGVTGYENDATQGPAAALACPAATVYRNYFSINETGQLGGYANQIDCLDEVGRVIGNDVNGHGMGRYWEMKNGYCLPVARNSMQSVGTIMQDPAVVEKVMACLKVGVHWDTQVGDDVHRVCQVFCSAVPVSYCRNTPTQDWAPLATAILRATYEATLSVAAIHARSRGSRVRVYLTQVGGGAFGNLREWIHDAITRALHTHRDSPLDVFLVHHGSVTHAIEYKN